MSNGSIVLVPLFCVYYGKFQKVKNNLSSVIFTGKSYIISTKEILKFGYNFVTCIYPQTFPKKLF